MSFIIALFVLLYGTLALIVLEVVLHKSLSDAFIKNSKVIRNNYINLRKKEVKGSVLKTIEFIATQYSYSRYRVREVIRKEAFNQKERVDDLLKLLGDRDFFKYVKLFTEGSFLYDCGKFAVLVETGNYINEYNITLTEETRKTFMLKADTEDEFFVDGKMANGNKFVGYAVFLPELNAYIMAYVNLDRYNRWVKNSVIFNIEKTNGVVNENNYIFINTMDGEAIITNNKVINDGRKLWQVSKVPKKAKEVFKKELKACEKGGGFIEYSWIEPKTGKVERKISYIGCFADWGWIIGEGFYIDEANAVIGNINNRLKQSIITVERGFFVLLIIGIIIVAGIAWVSFNITKRKIENLLHEIEDAFKNNSILNQEKYKIKEIEKFTRYINLALLKFRDYENEFLEAFIKATEARDPYTKGHSQRVAFYSKIIAKKLGMSESKQEELYRAGLLHDIGKIGVPDNILLKPGRLTKNEYKIIQYHPIFSYQIVANISRFKEMANYIKHHHERCDGSGYPDGLKCDEIEIEAKILAIADVFDALTSKRPYRDKLSPEKAIEIMKKEKLDQDILSKVENELIENCILEETKEVDAEIEEVDRIRNEIFDIDYKTGLKRRRVLIEKAKQFQSNNEPFAMFMIYLRDMAFLNYEFPPDAVDKVIYLITEYIVKTLEEMGYSEEYASRAYEDAFLFIVRQEGEKWFNRLEKLKDAIEKDIKKIVEDNSELKSFVDERNESIVHFVKIEVSYLTYPYEAKSFEDALYLLLLKRRKSVV